MRKLSKRRFCIRDFRRAVFGVNLIFPVGVLFHVLHAIVGKDDFIRAVLPCYGRRRFLGYLFVYTVVKGDDRIGVFFKFGGIARVLHDHFFMDGNELSVDFRVFDVFIMYAFLSKRKRTHHCFGICVDTECAFQGDGID